MERVSFVFELETQSYTNPDSTPPFDNEPVKWGDVNGDGKIGFSNTLGLEDVFANITVTDNIITYSGGELPNGTVFYNLFSTEPNLTPGGGIIASAAPPPADQDGPIRVKSYYTAAAPAAVPEPNSALGLIVFGSLGLALTLKRQLK